MTARLTDPETKVILLGDGQRYLYTINPVQITNVLGNSVTQLLEYSITDLNGKNHKLYKTKEGNWYDPISAILPDIDPQTIRIKLPVSS